MKTEKLSKDVFSISKDSKHCLIIFDKDCELNPKPTIVICRPQSLATIPIPPKKLKSALGNDYPLDATISYGKIITSDLEKIDFAAISSKELQDFLIKNSVSVDLIKNIFIESSNPVWRYNLLKMD